MSNYLDVREAIDSGGEEAALATPSEPADINCVLMGAALKADVAIVRMALDHGADVRATDSGGDTVLHMLIGCGRSEFEANPGIVSLLVERGADINARNNRGQTPLFLSITN